MLVFDIRSSDRACNRTVLFQQIEYRQTQIAFLVFQEFFTNSNIPQPEVLVISSTETAIHTIVQVVLEYPAIFAGKVYTHTNRLRKIMVVQRLLHFVGYIVVVGIVIQVEVNILTDITG